MKPGQGGVADAVETLVLGPVVGLAIGALFFVVAQIYVILWPMVAEGPFTEAFVSIGNALSISYSLFQLASTVETWIAVAVIVFALYGFAITLAGGNRRRR